jgi:tryptophanyl-tRNA synthetase
MKKRILSGMRPTGKLHIGHYVGALENWVALQEEYDNYHLVADYHVLTTNPDSSSIYDHSIDMVIDWVSAGIDPVKSPIFRQSQIKEHTELFLILSMLITTARLERNPTLKDQVRDLNLDSINFGYLGYPVLQAADILLYKGNIVPVGEDQVPHVEISRELARKFNQLYGEVFPEPDLKLTKFARLVGLDGNTKMSKSLNNTILLSDSKDEIQQKLRKAVTDPQKLRRGDPGRPEVCLVYSYHKKFNHTETEEIEKNCSSGALGCVDCKSKCALSIDGYIGPIREKRLYFENRTDEILAIINDGENQARNIAQKTMEEVREAMKLGQTK